MKKYIISYISTIKTKKAIRNFILKRNQMPGTIIPVDVPEICSKIEYYSGDDLIIRGEVEDVVFVVKETIEEKTDEFTIVNNVYTCMFIFLQEKLKKIKKKVMNKG